MSVAAGGPGYRMQRRAVGMVLFGGKILHGLLPASCPLFGVAIYLQRLASYSNCKQLLVMLGNCPGFFQECLVGLHLALSLLHEYLIPSLISFKLQWMHCGPRFCHHVMHFFLDILRSCLHFKVALMDDLLELVTRSVHTIVIVLRQLRS